MNIITTNATVTASSSSSSLTQSQLIREFSEIGIKLSSSLDELILDRLFSLSLLFDHSASELVMKYDAFKFSRRMNGSSITSAALDQFEEYVKASKATEMKKKLANHSKVNSILSHNSQRSQLINSDMISNLLDMNNMNELHSLFVTGKPKLEHLTNSQTPAKRKSANNTQMNDTTSNTENNSISKNRVGLSQLNESNVLVDESVLSSQSSYLARNNRGDVTLTYNESLAAATAINPAEYEASVSKPRIVDIEMHRSVEELEATNFRYQFQDDNVIRELLTQRFEQLISNLQAKEQFKQLVKQMKRERLEEDGVASAIEEDENNYDLVGCGVRSQESVLVAGRICINEEFDSRLTTNSVTLEGDLNLSDGLQQTIIASRLLPAQPRLTLSVVLSCPLCR
jgi:hypothetical protein